MRDIDGKKPEIFISCSRTRSVGKTVSFTRMLLSRRLENDEKFVLLCRTKGSLGQVARGILSETIRLFYPEIINIKEVSNPAKNFAEIMATIREENIEDGEDDASDTKMTLGYVIPINAAGQIKLFSSLFTDVTAIYFDEFLPVVSSEYVPSEVDKVLSIHKSLARGGGKSSRYLPIYMTSNTMSRAAPYFIKMNATRDGKTNFAQVLISNPNMRSYRGPGFVFQNYFDESTADEHAETGLARTFATADEYNRDLLWSGDSEVGIHPKPPKVWGPSTYIATIVGEDGRKFGLRAFNESWIYYISDKIDTTVPHVYRVILDGEPNLPMLRGTYIGKIIRSAISDGSMRYSSVLSKQLALQFLV